MRIYITTGTGEGPTELAAFDAALLVAGVADHNLVTLSSMIPAGAELVGASRPQLKGTWGQLLYVVLAQHRVKRIGAEAWAGLGWVRDEDSGRGMFVEHKGGSRNTVETRIEASLTSMAGSRRIPFGPIQLVTAGITCGEHPVCALAVATFGEPHAWPTDPAAAPTPGSSPGPPQPGEEEDAGQAVGHQRRPGGGGGPVAGDED